MWTVNTIANNYTEDISFNYVVLNGTTVQTTAWPAFGDSRTLALNIPYIGIMYFQDIGTTPLGPSTQTYGVLITLNQYQWIYRYEGTGQLNITINANGYPSFTSPNSGTIYLLNFSGYMRTYNGKNYLTVVDNGGLGEGANVPISTYSRTIGEYELFSIVWTDVAQNKFAILTSGGKYVTAVNGGGIGSGADTNAYPIITNATTPGDDELVIFRLHSDNKYVIMTKAGYYWTATNGGGWGEAPNTYPIHTDAGRLGGWETFTLVFPS